LSLSVNRSFDGVEGTAKLRKRKPAPPNVANQAMRE
jgi:hypothetical protein